MTKFQLKLEWDKAYSELNDLSSKAWNTFLRTEDERFFDVYDAINNMLNNEVSMIRSKDRKAQIEQKVNKMFDLLSAANQMLQAALTEYYA